MANKYRNKKRRKADIEQEKKMKFIQNNQVNIVIVLILSVLTFIVGGTIQLWEWKTTTDNNFVMVKKEIKEQKEKVMKLESSDNNIKVRLATIETDLKHILSVLTEIKEDLRSKK